MRESEIRVNGGWMDGLPFDSIKLMGSSITQLHTEAAE